MNPKPQIRWVDIKLDKLKISHIFFDACTINSFVDFQADEEMTAITSLGAIPCLILPIYLEILRGSDLAQRVRRQGFLDRHKFVNVGHQERMINEKALDLQRQLHEVNCHPEPEDLYLGAHLKSSVGQTFILSSNARHFPVPIYEKAGFIILPKVMK